MRFTLSASYKVAGMIGCDPEKDQAILSCVSHRPCDMGSGFGERDVAWYFDNEEEAEASRDRLNLIEGVKTSLSHEA